MLPRSLLHHAVLRVCISFTYDRPKFDAQKDSASNLGALTSFVV
jgi:hypothetical protein